MNICTGTGWLVKFGTKFRWPRFGPLPDWFGLGSCKCVRVGMTCRQHGRILTVLFLPPPARFATHRPTAFVSYFFRAVRSASAHRSVIQNYLPCSRFGFVNGFCAFERIPTSRAHTHTQDCRTYSVVDSRRSSGPFSLHLSSSVILQTKTNTAQINVGTCATDGFRGP